MTANSKVDTDEMRIAGLRAILRGTGEGPLWNTAADEIDRLRKALAWMTEHALQRADAHERLQKVIEDAPHAPGCAAGHVVAAVGLCNCWKATAL